MEKLSILCFGDSLTSGYHRYGLEYHSYAIKLTAFLEAEFPTTKIHLEVDGLPGDEVIHPAGEFLPRIRDQYEFRVLAKEMIFFLSDLGVGHRVDQIYHALEDCWNVALSSGAKVLAMTVPECAAKVDSLDKKRNTLNSHILRRESEQLRVIDLHSKIPYHSATEAFQREMFDDGLHLTAMGYDLMGTVVGERLVNLIKEEQGLKGET
ncbi:uncharacterized protein N7477_007966 [Penicillium maclennaniae]|uniref:uncharacterized protein n=1 Tax=Penicillium maclennaniae TaxID=1343394 RepID=UPI002540B645|nr:uncharacterized protein N7477_007966 [Penicillium maclennaniae]KAJ5665518.1 hypothetical protein N7477_007966 [Penicillium maclennaniae]